MQEALWQIYRLVVLALLGILAYSVTYGIYWLLHFLVKHAMSYGALEMIIIGLGFWWVVHKLVNK